MHNTKKKRFTKEDDRKIKEYFQTPECQRIKIKEFAKQLDHTARSIRERYKFYINTCKVFTEEESNQLKWAVTIEGTNWKNISIKYFGCKFSSLVLRDHYNKLTKKNKSTDNDVSEQDFYSIFDLFVAQNESFLPFDLNEAKYVIY